VAIQRGISHAWAKGREISCSFWARVTEISCPEENAGRVIGSVCAEMENVCAEMESVCLEERVIGSVCAEMENADAEEKETFCYRGSPAVLGSHVPNAPDDYNGSKCRSLHVLFLLPIQQRYYFQAIGHRLAREAHLLRLFCLRILRRHNRL